jgi:hypothetical protein
MRVGDWSVVMGEFDCYTAVRSAEGRCLSRRKSRFQQNAAGEPQTAADLAISTDIKRPQK